MKNDVTNIIISGVGGQGLVIATKIIAETAYYEGFDMKTSDVIGLSQRGGMVWGSVRIGKKVHAPSIPKGEGDILVAMEKLEGLRWSTNLRKNAKIILNEETIFPNRVLLEKEEYPDNIEEQLKAKGFDVVVLSADALAKEAGNIKTANMVLLGCLSIFLPFQQESWLKVIEENVPKHTIDVNLKAFHIGRGKAL